MANNVEDVTWDEFECASGKATLIPKLLKQLRSRSSSKREDALLELRNEIAHQGHVFPDVAAATAPLLVELITDEKMDQRAELTLLVADLACGGSHEHYLVGAVPPPFEPVIDDLVDAHRGLWVALLNSGETALACATSILVAFGSKRPESWGEPLATLVGSGGDTVTAAALLGLSTLARRGVKPDLTFPLPQSSSPAVKVGVLSLEAVRRDAFDDDDFMMGLELVGHTEPISDLAWANGRVDRLAIALVSASAAKQGRSDILSMLLDERPSAASAAGIVSQLLAVTLSAHTGVQLRAAKDLSRTETDLLTDLVKRKLLGPDSRQVLLRAGLFPDSSSLSKLLGVEAPSAIDTVVSEQPLWRHFNDHLNGREDYEQLRGAVEGYARGDVTRVLAVLKEAIGVYPVALAWPSDGAEVVATDGLVALIARLVSETLSIDVAVRELLHPTWLNASGFFYPRSNVFWESGLLVAVLRKNPEQVFEAGIERKALSLLERNAPPTELLTTIDGMTDDFRAKLLDKMSFSQGRDSSRGTVWYRGGWNLLGSAPASRICDLIIKALAGCKPGEVPMEPLTLALRRADGPCLARLRDWQHEAQPHQATALSEALGLLG
jgi:hypothetical protein